MTSQKYLFPAFLILFFSISFVHFSFKSPEKDRTDLLARAWIMSEMQVQGKKYSEKMLERQRQNGMVTILHFRKNGTCDVSIKSAKNKKNLRNTWRFEDNQQKLIITPSNEPAQVFFIEKLSSKKMVLSMVEGKEKQIFAYKEVKE
jgi:hypothetical protein